MRPLILVPLVTGLAVSGLSGASATDATGVLTNLVYLKSGSGRFVLLGSDRLYVASVLRWAEDLTGRIERFLRVDMPFENRWVRIVIREQPGLQTGGIEIGRFPSQDRLIDELVLSNPRFIEPQQAEEALCRVLLLGFISD
ncbi:MAG: hypothetical protein N2255_05825, partial [Kiritimatiellae bacterium]|nr:hypothetical protein [Kiritimatiellia bacterium]